MKTCKKAAILRDWGIHQQIPVSWIYVPVALSTLMNNLHCSMLRTTTQEIKDNILVSVFRDCDPWNGLVLNTTTRCQVFFFWAVCCTSSLSRLFLTTLRGESCFTACLIHLIPTLVINVKQERWVQGHCHPHCVIRGSPCSFSIWWCRTLILACLRVSTLRLVPCAQWPLVLQQSRAPWFQRCWLGAETEFISPCFPPQRRSHPSLLSSYLCWLCSSVC